MQGSPEPTQRFQIARAASLLPQLDLARRAMEQAAASSDPRLRQPSRPGAGQPLPGPLRGDPGLGRVRGPEAAQGAGRREGREWTPTWTARALPSRSAGPVAGSKSAPGLHPAGQASRRRDSACEISEYIVRYGLYEL